nr:hypothetical protein [Agrobacterium fabrum]
MTVSIFTAAWRNLSFAGLMGAGPKRKLRGQSSGPIPLDAGKIVFNGRELSIGSPQDAIEEGIA